MKKKSEIQELKEFLIVKFDQIDVRFDGLEQRVGGLEKLVKKNTQDIEILKTSLETNKSMLFGLDTFIRHNMMPRIITIEEDVLDLKKITNKLVEDNALNYIVITRVKEKVF